jgi:hypothetical protein
LYRNVHHSAIIPVLKSRYLQFLTYDYVVLNTVRSKLIIFFYINLQQRLVKAFLFLHRSLLYHAQIDVRAFCAIHSLQTSIDARLQRKRSKHLLDPSRQQQQLESIASRCSTDVLTKTQNNSHRSNSSVTASSNQLTRTSSGHLLSHGDSEPTAGLSSRRRLQRKASSSVCTML